MIDVSSAFVLLNCDIGSELSIIEQLNKIAGVSAVQVSGIYDIMAKLGEQSREELSGQIRRIRKIANIRSSLTMIVSQERSQ